MRTPRPRIIDVLGWAAPFAMAVRYSDGPSHCIEMSLAGAEVLRRRGIGASVGTCAIWAESLVKDVGVTVGLSAREVWARFSEPRPPFDDWIRDGGLVNVGGNSDPVHCVIETDCEHIDLTFGQLRRYGFRVPLVLIAPLADGHLTITADQWRASYIECPRSPDPSWPVNPGLVDDLDELVSLGRQLANHETFVTFLGRIHRPMFDVCIDNMTSWGLLP